MPVLPVGAYTSQEWFDREQEKIFGATWQFAGLQEDIEQEGDYLTVQCGNRNILVLRGRNGQLQAFHNLCRHRGTRLLDGQGSKLKVIQCAYHHWTYKLSGELAYVPQQEGEFPQIQKKGMCLHRAAVALCKGMVWVHPDPGAMPVETWFRDIMPHLGPP